MKPQQYLYKQTKSFLITLGLMLVVSLGLIDYLTGPEIAFSIFYLFPILLVTWFVGRSVGIVISIVSAVVWLLADLLAGHIYSHQIIPYWNMSMRFGFFCITVLIMSKLKYSLEQERNLARTDPLTQVPNSRHFMELANIEINRADRYRHPFTLAYLDLDNFKSVNDHFGHSVGDTLLLSVADTIKKSIRVVDIVARLAGDEFAILLPETGFESARLAVQRIQENLLVCMRKNEWPVTFSIGVVTFVKIASTVDEAIRTADTLMYSVKNGGKNGIKHEIFGEISRKGE
ncbi:MAG TPA: GGDEF domain-containing protein [Elusimicrobia bacterium]|jgi:diguanylate cyclase (GGDEF)-like protein|nr:GGDEF domain-containing protein [Elusimicrobiota bacterium]